MGDYSDGYVEEDDVVVEEEHEEEYEEIDDEEETNTESESSEDENIASGEHGSVIPSELDFSQDENVPAAGISDAPAYKKEKKISKLHIEQRSPYWGTAAGMTPRTRPAYIIPNESMHTCAAISRNEYSQVISSRCRILGKAGDDHGCLNPAQLSSLPSGNRIHAVAVGEILYKCCPFSIRRHVGYADNNSKVYEVIPVNKLIVPFAPVWPPPCSQNM